MILEVGTSFDVENIYETFNRYTLINSLTYGSSADSAKKTLSYYEDKYLHLNNMSVATLFNSFDETKKNIVYNLMNKQTYQDVSKINQEDIFYKNINYDVPTYYVTDKIINLISSQVTGAKIIAVCHQLEEKDTSSTTDVTVSGESSEIAEKEENEEVRVMW